MADELNEPEVSYGLVMPFVVVESVGGPYHDESFCTGYHTAQIAAELDAGKAMHSAVVRTPLVPQLDLIAMKAGYSVHLHDTDMDEWTNVIFVKEKSA